MTDISQQLIHANEVSQEEVGDDKGYGKEDYKLEYPFPDLFSIPWHLLQIALLLGISIDQILYLPEYHFHEDGLRACPSTEDAPVDNRKQYHEYNKRDHPDAEYEEILGPENHTEQYEFPFQDIKHQQGFPIYFYKWQCKENNQVKNAENRAQVIQFTLWFFWVNKIPFPFFGNGGNGIPECLLRQ